MPLDPSFSSRRMPQSWAIAAIFLLALVVRVIYLLQIRGNPFFTAPLLDAGFHVQWAKSIASGDWLGSDTAFVYRAPLYPYFLGIIFKWFGVDYWTPRLIQAILGAFSCVIAYKLALNVFGGPTAVLTGLIMSFYGLLIYKDGELLTTNLTVFTHLVCLVSMVRAENSPSKRNAAWAGSWLGFSALARPNVLVFMPIASVWSFLKIRSDRGIRTAVLYTVFFLGAVFFVISPVTLRNYLVAKDFILISCEAGENFNKGNEDGSTGFSAGKAAAQYGRSLAEGIRNRHMMIEKKVGRPLKPSEGDRAWFVETLRQMSPHPWRSFCHQLKKMYYFWNAYEISNNQEIYLFKEFSPLLNALIFRVGNFCFPFGLIAPLGILGMVLALPEFRKTALLHLYIISYMFSVVAFFVVARYRIPVIPPLILFASYAVVRGFRIFASSKMRPRVCYGCCFFALFFVVNSRFYPLPEPDTPRFYSHLSTAYLSRKLPRKAIAVLQKSISRRPNHGKSYLGLGRAYVQLGDYKKAEQMFEKAIEVDRRAWASAYLSLGGLYEKFPERYGDAVRSYQKYLDMELQDLRKNSVREKIRRLQERSKVWEQ